MLALSRWRVGLLVAAAAIVSACTTATSITGITGPIPPSQLTVRQTAFLDTLQRRMPLPVPHRQPRLPGQLTRPRRPGGRRGDPYQPHGPLDRPIGHRTPRHPVDQRMIVADSKQVYNPARGLIPLERGVLRALAVHRQCGERTNGEADSSLAPATYPTSFRQLFGQAKP